MRALARSVPFCLILILSAVASNAVVALEGSASTTTSGNPSPIPVEDRTPLAIAFLVPPVKSRFNAFLGFATEAARRNHVVQFWSFEGARDWVPPELQQQPNFAFRSVQPTATESNATLYKWQLEEFQRLQKEGGLRNTWESQKLKLEITRNGVRNVNGNFTHEACGAGGRADVAVVDLVNSGALQACQTAGVLLAVPNAQVISNVFSIAPHALEPTVVSFSLFPWLSEDLLLELSAAGTLGRLANAASTLMIEGTMYPAFLGFLRRAIFLPMTVPEIEGPREVGPLVRYIGPVVDENRQRPDADLDAWLDARPRGIAFVSMGTILSGEEHISAVATAVLRLAAAYDDGGPGGGLSVLWAVQEHQRQYIPQRLAERLEAHPLVRVQGHLPQLLVLKHRNTRLFVTHGGHNSVHEGLFYGKPLVVVPGAVDQGYNAGRVERSGAGVAAQPHADSIAAAVASVLQDPGFAKRAAVLSKSLQRAGGAAAGLDLIESMAYDHGGDVAPFVPNRLAAHWALQWGVDVRSVAFILLYVSLYFLRACCCGLRRRPGQSSTSGGKAKAA